MNAFQVEYRQAQAVTVPDYHGILTDESMSMRDRIIKLQESMIQAGGAMGDSMPLDHQFAPGTYARTIFMPAGHLVIGKIHRQACVNIMSKGKATVWTEHGERLIEAPSVWVSQPGTQRVVLNHEDVVWTTVHENPDNITDLEVLETQVILPDYSTIPIHELEAIGGEA